MKLSDYKKRLSIYGGKIREIAERYGCSEGQIRRDCFLSRLRDGANPDQYFAFRFYKLCRRERATFVTARKSARIEEIFNTAPREEIEQIASKALFNKTFARFIGRSWIYAPDASLEDFKAFLQENEKVIIKPDNQTQGKGVRLLTPEDLKEGPERFYETAVREKFLLEAFIDQHPVLRDVNPTSVNTARICTVRDAKGDVHIVGASLRGGGAGSVVDNLHADGVQYPVDIERGVIIGGGVRFNGESDIFYHPSTNTRMIGLQIPNWEQVKETVREAGRIPAHLRYIGWDIAITETGCELIEANIRQGSNGMQQDGIGKYRMIMQCR